MNNLKEYEEEIYKCSRCALCQSVCPVYKSSLNECAVSKGKFNMLNGVLNGDLKITAKLKKYLDLCTGCNACKDFCPSGIDVRKIFIAAKYEYYKNNKLPLLQKILLSYSFFCVVLKTASVFMKLYRFFKIGSFIKYFEKLLINSGFIGKYILLIDSLSKNVFYETTLKQVSGTKNKTALYFDGCFNKYLNPQTENAVKKILYDSDISLIKKDFGCCGISHLNDGNIEEFKKIVQNNLSKINTGFDYVLTDCASCRSVLKDYKSFFDSEAAKQFSDKTTSVAELIKGLNFEATKPCTVAIHKPCHEDFDFSGIVKNIKNTKYLEVEDYDKCCGFSGLFALKNPGVSKKISKSKALQYIKSNADFVLTTCPACILGLEQGFIEAGILSESRPKVLNLYVFLAQYCKVQE